MLRRIKQKQVQLAALGQEFVDAKKAAAKLYNPCHKGAGQSAEYVEAAKAFNSMLQAVSQEAYNQHSMVEA